MATLLEGKRIHLRGKLFIDPLTFVPTEETQSLGTPKYLSQKNPGTQLHLEMSPVIHVLKTMPLKQRLEIDAI